jgi:hypothetical protein
MGWAQTELCTRDLTHPISTSGIGAGPGAMQWSCGGLIEPELRSMRCGSLCTCTCPLLVVCGDGAAQWQCLL